MEKEKDVIKVNKKTVVSKELKYKTNMYAKKLKKSYKQTFKKSHSKAKNIKHFKTVTQQIKPPKKSKWLWVWRGVAGVLALIIVITSAVFIHNYYAKASFLKVNYDDENVWLYINDRKKATQRLEIPKVDYNTYSYVFNVDIFIVDNSSADYLVTFTLDCDKYDFSVITNFDQVDKVYSHVLKAGRKITLISRFDFTAEEAVTKFELNLDIKVQKI